MNNVSAIISVIALIEISLKIVSLYAKYYSYIKNIKRDIDRLYLEVKAFISILQNLNKLTRSLEATRLFALRSLNKNI